MIRNFFIKFNWILSSQFGLSPQIFFRSVRGIVTFFKDYMKFKKNYVGKITLKPCLHDRYEEGGTTKSEYFWQDLIVARWICEAKPIRHVDVGSRVDGFVAHVASFREIEVFDVRTVTTKIPGIVFKQADMMQSRYLNKGYCDSISCLHALEHFGLGRYGDPIDPDGYKKGIFNMASLLEKNGIFYLSVPIGKERVEFNANHVFDPKTIIELAKLNKLKVKNLTVISSYGDISEIPLEMDELNRLAQLHYNLGIFTCIKQS